MVDENNESSEPAFRTNGSRRRAKRTITLVTTAFVAAIVFSYIFRVHLLITAGRYLVINDSTHTADVILLFNGDQNRPLYAAQLFKEGLGQKIVIARERASPAVRSGLYPSGTDVAVSLMVDAGVGRDRISILEVPGGVTNTLDEARAFRLFVVESRVESVLAITSRYHTRRTRWILAREMRGVSVDLQIAGATHSQFDSSNWWTTEDGFVSYATEYLKLFYYVLRLDTLSSAVVVGPYWKSAEEVACRNLQAFLDNSGWSLNFGYRNFAVRLRRPSFSLFNL